MRSRSEQVSVVIPNWNGKAHLETCLNALSEQELKDFEVILVDNGSADGSVEFVKQKYPLVRIIIFKENKGFAVACNAGIAASEAEYVALLNNDTEPQQKWLGVLVRTLEIAPANVACLASKLLQMENPKLIDDAGDIFTWRGGAFKRGHGKSADAYNIQEEAMSPCAAAALYRKSVLDEVGAFDETFFTYLEDVDLGLRIRLAGYTCLYIPEAIVLHVGHGSAISRDRYIFFTTRNRLFIFYKNIPTVLLIRHFGSIAYGWLFFFLAHSVSWIYLRGTLAFFKHIPLMRRKRKQILSQKRLNVRTVDALLSHDWPEISLWELLRLRIRHIFAGKG